MGVYGEAYEDAEKVQYVPSGDFNVLSVPELEAVARAATTPQDAALYRVAGYTGLRIGELRALRWRDVDFLNASLHVRRNLPVHATVEKAPKGKRVRSVPLFDQPARALAGLSRRGYLTRPDDLVFVSKAGGHLDYRHVTDGFYVALSAAGLGHMRQSGMSFHDLRHSFGTLAIQAFPLVDVQAFMGHAKVTTTAIYLHHVPKADAAAKGTALIEAQMQTVSPLCPELVRSPPTERNSEQLSAA